MGAKKVLVEVKPVEGMGDPLFQRTATEIERNLERGEEALILSYFLPTVDWTGAAAIGGMAWTVMGFTSPLSPALDRLEAGRRDGPLAKAIRHQLSAAGE